MWSSAREIAAGDTVIVWLTRDQVQPLVVTPGKHFNTKFGNFKQSDFIGVPYGSKVVPKSGRGFIYILRPTPELWTIALPHRTQILYLADIAFIVSWLGIKKGSKVIEAGTGSASFSHSVSRTIGPTGHLWSYEFHEARFNKAKEEFSSHGMDNHVTIQHRNVCKDGFAIIDQADAVFLDLPAPWDAIDYAKQSLKKDRNSRICCFSPCIEQVLRTVNKLNEAGFTEITTYETLIRPIEVSQVPTPQPVSVVAEKLKASERKREEKRSRQIQANKEKLQKDKKRKREVEGDGEGQVHLTTTESACTDGEREGAQQAAELCPKRLKIDDEDMGMRHQEKECANDPSDTVPILTTTIPLELEGDAKSRSLAPISNHADHLRQSGLSSLTTTDASNPAPVPTTAPPPAPTKINLSKALPEVRGHTSYLTFACLVPSNLSVFASKSESVMTENEIAAESSETRSATSCPPGLATSNKDNEVT